MHEHPPFQLVGGHVALDFINTLDNRYDPERVQELLAGYPDFLRFCTQSGMIDSGQAEWLSAVEKDREAALGSVHELREALERVFGAITAETEIPASDLDVLNAVLRDAQSHRNLGIDGGGFGWRWSGVERSLYGPLWLIADAAASLLVSDDVKRLRQCGNRSCRWLFLDTSKNHSRRWCDMKLCGNRVKARNYYRRSREGQSAGCHLA